MTSLNITFEENGQLKVQPIGENLSKRKVLDILSIAFCGVCKGYDLDMTECSNFMLNIMSKSYYNNDKIDERLKEIREDR